MFFCMFETSVFDVPFFFLSTALYRHIWSEAWSTSFSAAAIFWTFLCRSCSFYNVVGLTLRHSVSQFLFRSHPIVKFDILSNFANELRSLSTPETLRWKICKVLCRNGTSHLETLVLEYAWITHDSQFAPASFQENCFAFGVNETEEIRNCAFCLVHFQHVSLLRLGPILKATSFLSFSLFKPTSAVFEQYIPSLA